MSELPLSDDQCDLLTAKVMDKLAAKAGCHAIDLNHSITEHHEMRRALLRAGYMLGALEMHESNEHFHARNAALMLLVSDLGIVLGRMVAGVNHLDKLVREWEPDHSSGADRAGWLRAKNASDEAMQLLAEMPARLKV